MSLSSSSSSSSRSSSSSSSSHDGEVVGDIEESGSLGGKRRNRESIMYSCWVHCIQATGLKKQGTTKQVSPIAVVNAFGKKQKTKKGDFGNTFSCVWDTALSFQKKMDIAEFEKEVIEIRIEDFKMLVNDLIGFVRFDANVVNKQTNNEFYRFWTPIVVVSGHKSDHQLGSQGKFQVSICVLSEDNIKQNPALPIHVYDLEVQMWKDMDNKKQVSDFDLNDKKYLQKKLDQKGEEDAGLTSDLWDIIHIRIYRGEFLPKTDTAGYCDGYVQLEYPGLMNRNQKLKSVTASSTANPVWNHEFEIPIVHDAPVTADRFDLALYDENKLERDELLGKCRFSIKDILKEEKLEDKPPFWRNVYRDLDDRAPTFRGRVLVDFSVEIGVKDARVSSQKCSPVDEKLVPKVCSYKLDVDLFEGISLPGGYSDYTVDFALGHSMKGDVDKGGFAWLSFDSKPTASRKHEREIQFSTRKSLIVHGLPFVPEDDRIDPATEADDERALFGYSGSSDRIPHTSVSSNFESKTVSSKPRAMLPDLIVYVCKKGGCTRKESMAFLRIPLDSTKRPTEDWEHGEDLTVFPDLFKPNNAPRCLPLTPCKELHEAICGFLLLRVSFAPLSLKDRSASSPVMQTVSLPAIVRQNYTFVANVYQARDLASVDESGLSSPIACVQLMEVDVKTRARMQTTFPIWMEAMTQTVNLPQDLNLAPDITVTLYHHLPKQLFRHRDPSIFMGKATVPARVCSGSRPGSYSASRPAWFPLQFEEHQFGSILLSFSLTPISSSSSSSSSSSITPLLSSSDSSLASHSLMERIGRWSHLSVDVSALAVRGAVAKKIERGGSEAGNKKKQATYVCESWNNEVQTFTQEQAEKGKITVFVKKPDDEVFYSSINIRVYDDKELVAVTSVGLDKILSLHMGWHRLINVLTRTEQFMSTKFIRLWKAFVKKRKASRPQQSSSSSSSLSSSSSSSSSSDAPLVPAVGPSPVRAPRTSKFAKLRETTPLLEPSSTSDDIPNSVKLDVKHQEDSVAISINNSSSHSMSSSSLSPPPIVSDNDHRLLAPRSVDADGKEVFDESSFAHVVCDKIPDKDVGNPFEMHWRVECEYENLPLTKSPFLEFDLNTGKDAVHQTFLEKLFAPSKHSVGKLRGSFYAYASSSSASSSSSSTVTLAPSKDEEKEDSSARFSSTNVFDASRYSTLSQYCVRVYVLRGLQLIAKSGNAEDCDPYIKVSIDGSGEEYKSRVIKGSVNPGFYQCFDFNKFVLPGACSDLVIECVNDNPVFVSDVIGASTIRLENRVFSKQWSGSRKPIERRALINEHTGRLPQGFIEVCVDVIPMQYASERPLDYLLKPPVRIPWELRVMLWNTKNVTPKKVYKHDGDCCCVDWCAPPNQSDIKLVCGMSGAKVKPQCTDTHLRSLDGEGIFNWRTIHAISLPAPEALCNLKVQVWNENWSPDDCIAEAVIPLWSFFEFARRKYEQDPKNADNWVHRIQRQYVAMKHPQTPDRGDVEISVELLPSSVVSTSASTFRASSGVDGFSSDPLKNAVSQVVPRPNRPETSFPWYRVDKQILFRCKYCWKRSRWWLLGALLLVLLIIGLLIYLKMKLLS